MARGKLVRSPYMAQRKIMQQPAQFTGYVVSGDELAQIIKQLGAIHKEFSQKVTAASDLIDRVNDHIDRANKELDKLSEVRDGIRYAKGKDGKDANEDAIAAKVLRNIEKPKDGETPEIDYNRIKADVMALIEIRDGKDAQVDYNKIIGLIKKSLKVNDIPGLRGEIDSYRNQLALSGKVYGKDTWARGGGDTVKAGTGVTITPNGDGQKVISATSSGIVIITVSGVIDDSNTVFTSASQPTLLNINGAFYQKTGGAITWSYSAGTITLSSPVGTGGSIYGVS